MIRTENTQNGKPNAAASCLTKMLSTIRMTGFDIRRASFTSMEDTLYVVDHIKPFNRRGCTRSIVVRGVPGEYTKIPLFQNDNSLLIYRYCEAMFKRNPSKIKNALVLGGGGGTVPFYLLRADREIVLDIVERCPEMIKISKKYFLHRFITGGRVRYDQGNAQDFDPMGKRYGFIFCDLFVRDQVVGFVTEYGFACKIHDMITADGLLVINAGCLSPEMQCKTSGAYTRVFKHVYMLKENQACIYICCDAGLKDISIKDGCYSKLDSLYYKRLIQC